jgi:hypothetical protein
LRAAAARPAGTRPDPGAMADPWGRFAAPPCGVPKPSGEPGLRPPPGRRRRAARGPRGTAHGAARNGARTNQASLHPCLAVGRVAGQA